MGQAGIGIHHHRQGGASEQLRKQSLHLFRPHTAVDPERVHPQPLQKGHGGGDAAAREQAALGIENHGGHHRQGGVLFCREHRRLEFVRIVHRFNQDEIGAGLLPRLCHLGKQGIGGLERQIPERLEQFARRSDIHRDPGRPAALLHRFPGNADALPHKLGGGIGSALAFERIGAEGIGRHDVAARIQIGAVDRADRVRALHVPALRHRALRQTRLLEHGAHRPVK